VDIENQNSYVIIQFMDFIIGFLLGYFLKEISLYLKRLSRWDLDNLSMDKEWDWMTHEDLP